MHPQQTQDPYDDEIDLMELISTLLAGWKTIMAGGFGAAIVAVIIAVNMQNVYTASVTLVPTTDSQKAGGRLGALAGQFGGLAAMAGINLAGGMGVDMATLGIETLQSRAFLTDFAKRHGLLVPLFATERWNAKTKEWVIDPDRYDVSSNTWIKDDDDEDEESTSAEPSDWKIYKRFSKVVNISQDKKSQVVTLTVESKSPEAAMQWANQLVADLNAFIRKRDVEESRRSIEFLTRQLESTSVAQMQTVIYGLIEEQTKTAMLAEVREGYAFRVVDPAVVPGEKTRPKRSIIVVMGGGLGGALACGWVLFQASRRKKQAEPMSGEGDARSV